MIPHVSDSLHLMFEAIKQFTIACWLWSSSSKSEPRKKSRLEVKSDRGILFNRVNKRLINNVKVFE
jgi:hypothetical protein